MQSKSYHEKHNAVAEKASIDIAPSAERNQKHNIDIKRCVIIVARPRRTAGHSGNIARPYGGEPSYQALSLRARATSSTVASGGAAEGPACDSPRRRLNAS